MPQVVRLAETALSTQVVPPALSGLVVGQAAHQRRLRADGIDHVEIRVGIRLILPVILAALWVPPIGLTAGPTAAVSEAFVQRR
jgi:hypothetical protein